MEVSYFDPGYFRNIKLVNNRSISQPAKYRSRSTLDFCPEESVGDYLQKVSSINIKRKVAKHLPCRIDLQEIEIQRQQKDLQLLLNKRFDYEVRLQQKHTELVVQSISHDQQVDQYQKRLLEYESFILQQNETIIKISQLLKQSQSNSLEQSEIIFELKQQLASDVAIQKKLDLTVVDYQRSITKQNHHIQNLERQCDEQSLFKKGSQNLIGTLKLDLQQLKEENDSLKQNLLDQVAKCDQLSLELKNQKDKNREHVNLIMQLSYDNVDLANKIRMLQPQLKSRVSTLEKEVQAWKNIVRQLADAMNGAKQGIIKMCQAIQQFQAELDAQSNQLFDKKYAVTIVELKKQSKQFRTHLFDIASQNDTALQLVNDMIQKQFDLISAAGMIAPQIDTTQEITQIVQEQDCDADLRAQCTQNDV